MRSTVSGTELRIDLSNSVIILEGQEFTIVDQVLSNAAVVRLAE